MSGPTSAGKGKTIEEALEDEKSALLAEKQVQLQETFDKHDGMVRSRTFPLFRRIGG
jgi:hypothetical protein